MFFIHSSAGDVLVAVVGSEARPWPWSCGVPALLSSCSQKKTLLMADILSPAC